MVVLAGRGEAEGETGGEEGGEGAGCALLMLSLAGGGGGECGWGFWVGG